MPTREPNLHRDRTAGLDTAPVVTTVERIVGERVVRMAGMETLAPRFVWRAVLAGGRIVYVKAETPTGDDDALLLEAWAMEQASRVGIPVPRVVGLADRCDGFDGPILVMEEAQGLPLPPAWRPAIPGEAQLDASRLARAWREAGTYLRALHSIRVAGFGRLDDSIFRASAIVRGKAASWAEFALPPAEHALADQTFRRWLPGDAANRIEQALGAGHHLFDRQREGRLLHDDIGAKHVYVANDGRVTSVIDFGDRCAGDPAWDLANLWLWEDEARLGWALEGYGDASMGFTDRVALCGLADGTRLAYKRFQQGRLGAAGAMVDRLVKRLSAF